MNAPTIHRNDAYEPHCLDGPAIIWADGLQEWYLNGLLHRIDGPAIIRENGCHAWYLNGESHRVGGPAVIYKDGDQEWYLNGNYITDEVITWIEEFDIPKDFTQWTDGHRALFRLNF